MFVLTRPKVWVKCVCYFLIYNEVDVIIFLFPIVNNSNKAPTIAFRYIITIYFMQMYDVEN